jgi:hypothetical protein
VDYDTLKAISKRLDKRKEILADKVTFGVDNWDTYKYIIGQIRSLNDLQQDLKDLLKKQELDNDDNARGAGE